MNHILKTSTGFALLLWCFAALGQTQQKPVTGVVLDQDKSPLIGVTVTIEGTTIGSLTNIKGEFSIDTKPGGVLVFSILGYQSKKVTVTDPGKPLNVTLVEESIGLDGVVVTALGIKRAERSLGYSVATVTNEDITNSASANWLSGLAGKVAGLNFDQASAGPSGSVRTTLRGESSIDPSRSEALFIVDGVPINSAMTGSGSSAYNSTAVEMPIDYGNGASDLNPDDIESVTVLKGASATALYGSRAANGAIIVTTKSGKDQKGIGVTVSSTVTFENAGYWPDFQNEYGSGSQNSLRDEQVYSFNSISGTYYPITEGGPYPIWGGTRQVTRSGQNQSWGPRFEGQMFYQYGALQPDGTYLATPWVARDWYKGFFETGITFNNYVSVEGNNGRGTSARVSFTDRRNEWITPNSGYTSQSVSFSATTPVNRHITLNARLTYLNKKSDNLPMSGYGRSTIPYLFLWSTPSVDVNWYRDYKTWLENSDYVTNNVFYANGDSPYFQAYEQLNTMDRDRVYGTVDLSINLAKNLDLVLRTGLDMSGEFRTWRKPWGSVNYERGRYREQLIYQKEFNNDFLLKYDRNFSNFGFTASVGGNLLYQGYNSTTAEAVQLERRGEYSLSNSVGQLLPSYNRRSKKVNSLYGILQMSWKDYLFVDVTGRNDWSSALQKGNNSYFYPSVSTSFLLSEFFEMSRDIDILKARASWANVGNDTDAYRIHNDYVASSFGGGVTPPTNYASPDIKPEMVESWEFGLEGKFFRGRVGFDVTYYDAVSYNQILNTPVDPAVGYYTTTINAGKITNKGWEVTLSGAPVRNKKVKWNVSVVYARNRNHVVELAPGVDTWIISSSGRAQVEARPGGTLGAIYGTGFQRAPQGATTTLEDGTQKDISGAILYDAAGYPLIESDQLLYLGETQNKWKGGITNTVTYKGFRLSVQVDGAFGGRAHSMTHALLSCHGLLTNTLYGRYDGLIGDGYRYDEVSGTYSKNTVVTESISRYYDYYYNRDNIETNIFSTSFIKLREARLEFAIPSKLAAKTKVLRGASIAVFGRNLFTWTDWPQYDPEIASLNGSDITRGFESGSFPMTRSWGVNLKLKF